MTYRSTIAAAALAALLGAGTASAQGFMGTDPVEVDPTFIRVDLLSAEADGYVVAYEYQGGEFGEMLGSAPVVAGANSNILISFSQPATGNIAAVLYEGEPTTPDLAVDWVEVDADGLIVPRAPTEG